MRHKKELSAFLVLVLSANIFSGFVKSAEVTPIAPIPKGAFKPVETPPQIPTPSQTVRKVITETIPAPIKDPTRIHIPLPKAPVTVVSKLVPTQTSPVFSKSGFRLDRNVSWYGPGFYGKRTACGLAYTKTIKGVANKTLPCGTKVTFHWGSKTITVPVIDRGPYVAGRQWDLSGGLCVYLNHCFTGKIWYRING